MPLINIFSNIWIYVSNYEISSKENKNLYNEYMYEITKIKQIHNIKKAINLDNEVRFWRDKTQFINEIQQQILINRQKNLIKIYDKCINLLEKYLYNSESLLLYSFDIHECIIGLYLYFLKKKGNVQLKKSRLTLLSKFTGLNIELSDDMKKLIYIICQ